MPTPSELREGHPDVPLDLLRAPPRNKQVDDEALVNDVGTAIMALTRSLRRHGLAPATGIVLDRDSYLRFKMTHLPFDIRGGVPSMTIAGVRLVEE